MIELRPCGGCRRHVSTTEHACPFCGAMLVASALSMPRFGRMSRAAVFIVGAAGCYTSTPTPASPTGSDTAATTTSPPPPPPPTTTFAQPPPPPPPPTRTAVTPLSREAALKQWQSESPGSMPDAAIAPRPRAGHASFVCRVVTLDSAPMRDAEVKLVGPETRAERTGRDGLVFIENLTPGRYQVTVGRRRNPADPVIATSVQLVADVVTPMATLGERGPTTAKPVDEPPCCMPYGAPPARRRVV